MKKLFIIGGTMGIGKTTICEALKNKLDISWWGYMLGYESIPSEYWN